MDTNFNKRALLNLKKMFDETCSTDYIIHCLYDFSDEYERGMAHYFQITKKNIDILSIKKKFETGQYTTPKQFIDDIQLLVENCINAFPATHKIAACAVLLEKKFSKKFKKIYRNFVPVHTRINYDTEHVLIPNICGHHNLNRVAEPLQQNAELAVLESSERFSSLQLDDRSTQQHEGNPTYVPKRLFGSGVEQTVPTGLLQQNKEKLNQKKSTIAVLFGDVPSPNKNVSNKEKDTPNTTSRSRMDYSKNTRSENSMSDSNLGHRNKSPYREKSCSRQRSSNVEQQSSHNSTPQNFHEFFQSSVQDNLITEVPPKRRKDEFLTTPPLIRNEQQGGQYHQISAQSVPHDTKKHHQICPELLSRSAPSNLPLNTNGREQQAEAHRQTQAQNLPSSQIQQKFVHGNEHQCRSTTPQLRLYDKQEYSNTTPTRTAYIANKYNETTPNRSTPTTHFEMPKTASCKIPNYSTPNMHFEKPRMTASTTPTCYTSNTYYETPRTTQQSKLYSAPQRKATAPIRPGKMLQLNEISDEKNTPNFSIQQRAPQSREYNSRNSNCKDLGVSPITPQNKGNGEQFTENIAHQRAYHRDTTPTHSERVKEMSQRSSQSSDRKGSVPDKNNETTPKYCTPPTRQADSTPSYTAPQRRATVPLRPGKLLQFDVLVSPQQQSNQNNSKDANFQQLAQCQSDTSQQSIPDSLEHLSFAPTAQVRTSRVTPQTQQRVAQLIKPQPQTSQTVQQTTTKGRPTSNKNKMKFSPITNAEAYGAVPQKKGRLAANAAKGEPQTKAAVEKSKQIESKENTQVDPAAPKPKRKYVRKAKLGVSVDGESATTPDSATKIAPVAKRPYTRRKKDAPAPQIPTAKAVVPATATNASEKQQAKQLFSNAAVESPPQKNVGNKLQEKSKEPQLHSGPPKKLPTPQQLALFQPLEELPKNSPLSQHPVDFPRFQSAPHQILSSVPSPSANSSNTAFRADHTMQQNQLSSSPYFSTIRQMPSAGEFHPSRQQCLNFKANSQPNFAAYSSLYKGPPPAVSPAQHDSLQAQQSVHSLRVQTKNDSEKEKVTTEESRDSSSESSSNGSSSGSGSDSGSSSDSSSSEEQ